MLKLVLIKPLGKILKQLDAEKLFADIRAIQDADTADGKGKVGEVIITAIVDNLADTADNLIELCAAYKNVTVEDAGQLDAIKTIMELIGEVGFSDFLASASAGNTPK